MTHIVALFILIGCFHGLYMGYALFTARRQVPANSALAALILAMVVILAIILLDETGHIRLVPHLSYLSDPLGLILAPLLYTYVAQLTATEADYWRRRHFVLAVLFLLLCLPFYFSSAEFKLIFAQPYEQMMAELDSTENNKGHFYLWVFDSLYFVLLLIQVGGYLLLIFHRLSQHRKVIDDNFSDHHGKTLTWLSVLCGVFAGLYIFWSVDEIIEMNAAVCFDGSGGLVCDIDWLLADREYYFSDLGMVLCIYLISIFALKQPQIFNLSRQIEHKSSTKYQKSALDQQLSAEIFSQLNGFVLKHQPYISRA